MTVISKTSGSGYGAVAAGCRVVEQERAARKRAPLAFLTMFALAIALSACGSTSPTLSSGQSPAPPITRSAHTSAQSLSSSSAATQATVPTGRPARSHIDAIVEVAKQTYNAEANGPKLLQELGRIARDGVLLDALSRGDLAAAQAEADSQLRRPLNHIAHVTRISVIRGARVLVNATVNSDGVFVVAPGKRVLRVHGRLLGTLLVSIQDVTGFVKLVHNLTLAQVVARGASGRVRVSPGATAPRAGLPTSGHITIAGRRYVVRSFHETAWGNEPLTVWVLAGA
jgi:hypothetical protein